MTIELPSGRVIVIDELHQWPTYAGLLAGRPDADMNRRRVAEQLAKARDYGVPDAQPCLIAPKAALRQWESRGTVLREERLPAVSCIAVFTSGELAREDSEPYSSLTVVWFQDRFAMPIAPDVADAIRTIDWEAKANDWCP